ncbi:MAG TPA: DUF5011 domain-containing protein [Candidatus Nitrosotenuis sp.]|nr:DUF5011 domain-containing protein [Candidatus Nitrosotenuis sp.]
MTTKLAITAILMFAVVLGIGAVTPALADNGHGSEHGKGNGHSEKDNGHWGNRDEAPGHNKVSICHFSEEENQYVLISIPHHAAEKHLEHHEKDVKPTDGVCPIIDTSAPAITLIGENPILVELNVDTYVEQGANATDDVDGDISSSIVIGGDAVDESTLGTYIITYDVSDSAGNNATQVTRTVNVVDTLAPIITLNGSETISLTVGDVYTEQGATVADNDPATPTTAAIDGDIVDTSTPGTYIVTYDAVDPSGNFATQVTRTVTVS